MRDKPDFCYASGCPLAEKGRGFVPGSGDPSKARLGIILEAPGNDEVGFLLKPVAGRRFFATQEECDKELARRAGRYIDIPVEQLRRGAPIVGKTGSLLQQWVFAGMGISRDKVFLDNTLRCLPPKVKDKQYPIGEERKEAERCCRHYDRFDEFKPEALVATIHPAALMREVTPLPLMVQDVAKARDFSQQGLKTLLLMGGKSVKAFMRYGENVSRWRGSYELVGEDWYSTVLTHFNKGTVEGKRRTKKQVFLDDPNDPLNFLSDGRVRRKKFHVPDERPQCAGRIKSGAACTKRAKVGDTLCGTHRKAADNAKA